MQFTDRKRVAKVRDEGYDSSNDVEKKNNGKQ